MLYATYPKGYTIALNQSSYNLNTGEAADFTVNNGELGDTVEYLRRGPGKRPIAGRQPYDHFLHATRHRHQYKFLHQRRNRLFHLAHGPLQSEKGRRSYGLGNAGRDRTARLLDFREPRDDRP